MASILAKVTNLYRLENALSQIADDQAATKKTVHDASMLLQAGFANLSETLAAGIRAAEAPSQVLITLENSLAYHSDLLSSKLDDACSSTQNIEARLDAFVDEKYKAAHLYDNQLRHLRNELEQRKTEVDHLQRQLQLETEEYQETIRRMEAESKASDQAVELEMTEITADFENRLIEALRQERQAFTDKIRDNEEKVRMSETTANTWKNQLEEAQFKLSAVIANENAELLALRQNLESEKSQVSELQHQISSQEASLESTNLLHARWRKDIEAVEAIRIQLGTLGECISHVQRGEDGLRRAVEMNDLLQSTSTYIAEKQSWVREQLRSTTQRQASVQTHSVGASGSADRVASGLSSFQDKGKPALNHDTKTPQRDLDNRHVTVKSPGGSVASPVPPSVWQEQARRREGWHPQSILRSEAANPGSMGSANMKSELHAVSMWAQSNQSISESFDVVDGHNRFNKAGNKDLLPNTSINKDLAVAAIRSQVMASIEISDLSSLPSLVETDAQGLLGAGGACKRPEHFQNAQAAKQRTLRALQ